MDEHADLRAAPEQRRGHRYCCFLGCPKPAEFEIWDENERRPDIGATDACEDHVGALLGSLPPVEPTGPWRVVVLAQEKPKEER